MMRLRDEVRRGEGCGCESLQGPHEGLEEGPVQ